MRNSVQSVLIRLDILVIKLLKVAYWILGFFEGLLLANCNHALMLSSTNTH